MPRSSKHIVIEGQYASGVLGTFRIIRGFATLQDLAAISAPFEMTPAVGADPVQGHQRAVRPEHAQEIKRYLQDGNLRFIPEIILSVRGEFTDEVDATQKQIGISGTGVDGIEVTRRWKSPNIRTHQIKVEKARVPQLVMQERRIRRIDGNHRLHLANDLADDPTIPTKYLAPFCAVLLAPTGDPNDDYVESMLFHTINSTALPLDSEHALSLILGQAPGFGQTPDEEFAMSAPLHLTRLMKGPIDAFPAPQKARLGGTPNTVLYASAKAIVGANAEVKADRNSMQAFSTDFTGALNDILARLPATVPEFCKADFFIELAALAWQEGAAETHDERVNAAIATLEGLAHWLGRDGFDKIRDGGERSLAEQLFELYRTARDRVPKRVFLARWYPDDGDGEDLTRATHRLTQLQEVCNELDLELIDMGTQIGGTYDIPTAMYTAIQSSDIFMADLTGIRPNVMIEVGYGLKHHERGRMIIFHEKREGESVPFDIRGFQYVALEQAVEVKTTLKPVLKAILEQAKSGAI